MEYWSVGALEKDQLKRVFPIIHYANTPIHQCAERLEGINSFGKGEKPKILTAQLREPKLTSQKGNIAAGAPHKGILRPMLRGLVK